MFDFTGLDVVSAIEAPRFEDRFISRPAAEFGRVAVEGLSASAMQAADSIFGVVKNTRGHLDILGGVTSLGLPSKEEEKKDPELAMARPLLRMGLGAGLLGL